MLDNYQLQALQAKQVFLSYDQDALIRKCSLRADSQYLYCRFFSEEHRIHRRTGDMSRNHLGTWIPADSHGQVMTLLDLICDSRDDRHLRGTFQNMQTFGHQFHQNLNEDQENPAAARFQQDPEALRRACLALGGVPFSPGDVAYTVPVFEDLGLTIQFFLGDEEFAPRIRYLWDENALQYLKYETMYYAVGVLMDRIWECWS